MADPHKQHGLTYLALLFAIAIIAAGTASLAAVWSTASQRQKEAELAFIGNEVTGAIRTYYNASPGSVKQYPRSLEDLIRDKRQLAVTRYLRRIYPDPISGEMHWGLVSAPDGGVMGIYSLSDKTPVMSHPIREANVELRVIPAERYSDIKFVYRAPAAKL